MSTRVGALPTRHTRAWWSRVRSVFRTELRIQRREPATVLYWLVFCLLTFGFVTSGTVELVRGRGALPKLSPLAITLAMGGLTAFGQVLTTMVVASAMLRDSAGRTDALLFTTALDRPAWVVGRWAALSTILLVVYSGLAAGVFVGALAPWVSEHVGWDAVLVRTVSPWITITLPTALAVGTLLTALAVRTQRLLGVLSGALLLLFLWQGAEAIAQRAEWSGGAARAAALADPFGTVAVQVVTAAWSAEARASDPVPISGLVGAGRLLWLILAGLAGAWTLRAASAWGVSARSSSSEVPGAAGRPTSALAGRSPLLTVAAFTVRWTWRERGWRAIAALGVLNVFVHAVAASGGIATDAPATTGTLSNAELMRDLPRVVLSLVQEHARLFLILLATIYAGELLWRDQDERVVELVESTPVPRSVLVGGRVLGLMVSQAMLVMVLLAGATLGVAAVSRVMPDVGTLVLGGVLWLWLPFVHWLVLSLTVHVLIRHKVIAHLALIAGWVAAVALDANGVTSPWLRFADPPTLVEGAPLAVGAATWGALWWSTVSAGLFALALFGWRRATSRR